MKKSQIDLLYQQKSIQIDNPVFNIPPKNHQQQFLHTYLAINLLKQNVEIPIIEKLINSINGSFSQLLLLTQYMKYCMDKTINLQNPNFHILNTIILWMSELQKIQDNPKPNIVYSVLLPHPNQLKFYHYQQLLVYFNYVSGDLKKIIKNAQTDADDLLQLLQIILPKIYYNIIIPPQTIGLESGQADTLFYNQSIDYFVRTCQNYQLLCKFTLKKLLIQSLKQNQMRELLERACRYYLLFYKQKISTELFISAFDKATDAARYSISDQLLLFFKFIRKLGDKHLENIICSRYEWANNLISRLNDFSVIGHPKGEINPFNPIGIKQTVRVESRKTANRIIEIYNQYSLLYFKLQIENHDITVRLYYLGDFQSKVQVKKLLSTHEKISQQICSAFIAAKKGIYMIQFDNSYSWINGKNLKFQYVLLSQLKPSKYPEWYNILFSKSEDEKVSEIKLEKVVESNGVIEQDSLLKIEQKSTTFGKLPQYTEFQQSENKIDEQKIIQKQVEIEKVVEKQIMEQILVQQVNILKQQSKKNQQIIIKQLSNEDLKVQVQKSSLIKELVEQQFKIQKQQNTRQVQTELKPEVLQIKSQNSIMSQKSNQNQRMQWGHANLSLIDNIFSLLVNLKDHTYEFETNLQDRIVKRLKSYCQGQDKLQWIFNSQARDWLKRKGFITMIKSGATLLFTADSNKIKSQMIKSQVLKNNQQNE